MGKIKVLATDADVHPGAGNIGYAAGIRHFKRLQDFNNETLLDILNLADEMKQQAFRRPIAAGKMLGLLFFNPSLRTKVSFETTAAHFGAGVSVIAPGQGSWSLEMKEGAIMDADKTEHIKEAIQVLSQYCDAIGVRSFATLKNMFDDYSEMVLNTVSKHASVPIINLESAMGHPCQAMADWMTVREEFGTDHLKGKKLVLTWAPHPFPLPQAVPLSVLDFATRSGMDVTLAAPPEMVPDEQFMALFRQQSESMGSNFEIIHDQRQAMNGADVVYAKAWASPLVYSDPALESRLRLETYRDWTVDAEKMKSTNQARFMHCLPVRRNVVVTDAVLDSPTSIHIRQAANRLHAQKAILRTLWNI